MKPFRKHVAIAIDGGGIRGIVATRALELLEEHIGCPLPEVFRLVAGTSTGAIIAGGLAANKSAAQLNQLYLELGASIFRKRLRARLWPLTRYRYPLDPLIQALEQNLGGGTVGDIWDAEVRHDLVMTTFDLTTNHTCFIKPWKPMYEKWPLARAIAASCVVPTYFPPLAGRFVDGGVGAYTNPCYLAAYEAAFYLRWDPAETTLISLGTGREPRGLDAGQANKFYAWEWLDPVLGAFMQSADDQQVHLVNTFFGQLDFRRFQVDLDKPYLMDDASKLSTLVQYGERLGHKILNDEIDPILEIKAGQPHD